MTLFTVAATRVVLLQHLLISPWFVIYFYFYFLPFCVIEELFCVYFSLIAGLRMRNTCNIYVILIVNEPAAESHQFMPINFWIFFQMVCLMDFAFFSLWGFHFFDTFFSEFFQQYSTLLCFIPSRSIHSCIHSMCQCRMDFCWHWFKIQIQVIYCSCANSVCSLFIWANCPLDGMIKTVNIRSSYTWYETSQAKTSQAKRHPMQWNQIAFFS